MAKREHLEASGTIRHTAKATNLDFIAYKSWKASMTKEELVTKNFLWWTYQGWEKTGTPLGFTPQWQNGIGVIINASPIINSSTGYFSADELYFWSMTAAPPDNEAVSSIASMRMDYEFNGEKFDLVEGKNWITYISAGIVILAIIAVVGYLVLPVLAL